MCYVILFHIHNTYQISTDIQCLHRNPDPLCDGIITRSPQEMLRTLHTYVL